ncbi:MAG: 3-deoxy-7-phosphoheptulonate synthase [Firmicutes bacterium]|nr:3-deoxy-7-phosphoheptulonate synthase [Bacillota bacterium]
MIIIMRRGATPEEIEQVKAKLEGLGFGVHLSEGVKRTILGAIGGDKSKIDVEQLMSLPGVERVVHVMEPYKLVSRAFHPDDTVVEVGDVKVGSGTLTVIAGPCAVENYTTLLETAKEVKKAGATILRGGSFKPRTSPYSFQGHGLEGLKMLASAGKAVGLPVVTEVMDTRDVEVVAQYADLLQIGARNAQNYPLLKEVGQSGVPVLLKRGMHCTYEDWLLAAEYIASSGNTQIILAERGIRTFETHTRNTLDLSAVPVIHKLSHLPVVVDPSHATGQAELVPAMAKAAVAAGSDALMIEVHHNPQTAWCDGRQSLNFQQFSQLMDEIRTIAQAIGRKVAA